MADEGRGTYQFTYGPGTPYARAVELVARHRAGGEVVVDLGCGYGAVAEPLRDLGLVYLGVDAEGGGLRSLAERGMEHLAADLSRPGELLGELERALRGRPVAAVCALDVLEHLVEPEELLAALSRWCLGRGGVPLVVSVPNVTHVDVGVKVLLGRWDVTPTGLLDRTHLRFFSPGALSRTMAGAGWREVGAADFELVQSDQHFPPDAAALERSTPLGALLARVRREAAPGWLTNQFVRAYMPAGPGGTERVPGPGGPAEPGGTERPAVAGGPAEPAEGSAQAPFLSVLVRTQGRRMSTLSETLLSLAAQSCDDFEVLVLPHDAGEAALSEIGEMVAEFHPSFSCRVRVVPVAGGGRARPLNVGARLARGRYLAALDDDDLVFAHWVETLRDAALAAPGRVLHIGVASQEVAQAAVAEAGGTAKAWGGEPGAYEVRGRPRCPYPLRFDLVEHLRENATPNNGYAVPRSFVVDMGQGYDESLAVFEDYDMLLRAASWCGVHSTGVVGGLIRVWAEGQGENSSSAHDEAEWQAALRTVQQKLDEAPLLLGPGSRARLVELLEQQRAAERRCAELSAERDALDGALTSARAELVELRASSSWRLTAPLRALSGRLRRLRSGRRSVAGKA